MSHSDENDVKAPCAFIGKVDGLVAFLRKSVPFHFLEDNLDSAQIFVTQCTCPTPLTTPFIPKALKYFLIKS